MTREETWKVLNRLGVADGEMPEGELNLSGAKLSGHDLKKFYLQGANLQRADLRGADLYKAHLRGAKLSESTLSRASLSRADLYMADLTRANLYMTDLIESDLSRAKLYEADLLWTNLYGADLNEADLTLANLTNANLCNASLCNCTLRDASLVGTNLSLANLSEADLNGVSIMDITTTGWTIKNVRADYIYFTTDAYNKVEKEKHRLDMAPGEFETMFMSYPAIELLADTPNPHDDVMTLRAILDYINVSHAELSLRISSVSFWGNRFHVKINTTKDEYLTKSAVLIGNALQSVLKGNFPSESFSESLNSTASYYVISPKKQTLPIWFSKVAINLINSEGVVQSGGEVTGTISATADEG